MRSQLLERAIEVATERGDAEGAFRLEAQLSLLVRQPLARRARRGSRRTSTASSPTA